MASPAEAEGGGGRRGDGLWLPGLILSGAAILLRPNLLEYGREFAAAI